MKKRLTNRDKVLELLYNMDEDSLARLVQQSSELVDYMTDCDAELDNEGNVFCREGDNAGAENCLSCTTEWLNQPWRCCRTCLYAELKPDPLTDVCHAGLNRKADKWDVDGCDDWKEDK